MQHEWRLVQHVPGLFQSSPAPKGRCNACLTAEGAATGVSILTGPEGPMQLRRVELVPLALRVSILTGPEGPMQPLDHPCQL